MSNIIETLLLRNCRKSLVKATPNADAPLSRSYTPKIAWSTWLSAVPRARRTHRICGELRASHPSYVYTPHNAPIVVQDGGRVDWGSGPAGEPPRYTGIDIIITRDDKISALYVFLNSPPI